MKSTFVNQKSLRYGIFLLLSAGLTPLSGLRAQETVIPDGSPMASAPDGQQTLLLSPMERGAVTNRGAYRLKDTRVQPYPGLAAKVGQEALQFSAIAAGEGAKGDFAIATGSLDGIQALGLWVYIASDSNARDVGFQIYDDEGEALKAEVPVDWEGWQWVEMNVRSDVFSPAYDQADKNGQVDLPLKGIHIIWFAGGEGPTTIGVDALTALTLPIENGEPYRLESISPSWSEPGKPFTGTLLIHNFLDHEQEFTLTAALQSNPQYRSPALPDPVYGSDHLQGRPSWLEMNGERIENGSLTDNDPETMLTPAMPKEGISEIFHTVDLEQIRSIVALRAKPGDGNWIRKIDISSSRDGENFVPVDDLQNINLHQQWSYETFELSQPFEARFLRIRYHDEGANLPGHFRTLASLLVYDGLEDETIEIPSVGETVFSRSLNIRVPPGTFRVVHLEPTEVLGPNAYQLCLMINHGGLKKIQLSDYFVMPEGQVEIRPESRFGINVNSPREITEIVAAGFGWVRFENMKWQFYNPAPGDFRFDGTVGPWYVPMDEYFREFNRAGLSILPYIFETPKWSTSAAEDVKKNPYRYPPKDPADYGKAIYQAVARYGSKEVPSEHLLTADKRTGLDLINTYELWNEPNLTAPGWGFFVGPLDEYYKVFRAGAEALKAANPDAKATNGGWAGLSMDFVDTMRTQTYPDGKTPLDFTDVLNVHYYTGKQEPEFATTDPNANRSGKINPDALRLEDSMINLADWRDRHKPGMPIWITETGYDVGGPIGRTERHQAAKLPRGALMSFANGIDKVMIYRIGGSNPTHHGGAGLLRNDGSLRASYFTMATLIRQLDNVTDQRSYRLHTDDPRLWLYYWKQESGNVLSAHAPEGDAPAPLGLNLGRCLVTNAFGGQKEMDVTEDFEVGEFPVYIRQISNQNVINQLLEEAMLREQTRRKEMDFLAQSHPYLIDFGSHEEVGKKRVGTIRSFTTVVKEDGYIAERGYGFVGNVPGKNVNAGWIRGMLDKDFIQLHQPAVFRLDAAPGVYEFRLKAMNYKDGAQLTVSGGQEGDIEVPLPLENDAMPTPPVTVTVIDGQPLEIQLPAGNVQWLTLIPRYHE